MLNFFYRGIYRKERGWSLPEILVGLVIMVVIGAWAMSNLIGQRAKAVDGGVKSDIQSMAIQQETFITDNPTRKGVEYSNGAFRAPAGVTTLDDDLASLQTTYKKTKNNVIVAYMTPENNGGNPATVDTEERGYCIAGWNTDGSRQGPLDDAFWYDSALGGMQEGKERPNGGACEAIGGSMPSA